MKKLFFTCCMFFLAASFTNQLNAQTTNCTSAQMASCKKVCNTTVAAKCTPAQKAACQKVCTKSASSQVATNETETNNFLQLVNLTSYTEKASCNKPCASTKLTKNEASSCTPKNTKVVKNENPREAPLAQKVVLKTSTNE